MSIPISRKPDFSGSCENRGIKIIRRTVLDIDLNVGNSEERGLSDESVRIFRKVGSEVSWSYLIWNKQLWYNDKRGEPHDKGFKGDHTDHIHVSWSQALSQKSNFALLINDLAASASMIGVEDVAT